MTCPICRRPMTPSPLLPACASTAPPSGTVYSCEACDYAMTTASFKGATLTITAEPLVRP